MDKRPSPDAIPPDRGRSVWEGRGLPQFESVAAAISVIRLSRIVRAALDDVLATLDITFGHYEVLGHLAFKKDGRSQLGRLCRLLDVHPASMTNTIDRMAERQLVERSADPTDRRAVIVRITPQGAKLYGQATSALLDIRFGMRTLDNAQLDTVTAILGDLYEAYNLPAGNPSPLGSFTATDQ
jgi:DNA-binding MarR family transcriptional regulator